MEEKKSAILMIAIELSEADAELNTFDLGEIKKAQDEGRCRAVLMPYSAGVEEKGQRPFALCNAAYNLSETWDGPSGDLPAVYFRLVPTTTAAPTEASEQT